MQVKAASDPEKRIPIGRQITVPQQDAPGKRICPGFLDANVTVTSAATEIPKIPHEKIRNASVIRLQRIEDGERDFRF